MHDSHTFIYFYMKFYWFVADLLGQEMASVGSVVSLDEDKDFKIVQQFLQRRGSSSLTLDDVYR